MRTMSVGPQRTFDRLHRYTLALFVSSLSLSMTAGTAGAYDFPVWGLFETTIDYADETGGDHSYADPFYGVDLKATFISPSGRHIQWRGFFDGDGQGGQTGNIWKVRFMPDELGWWGYTWRFVDGSASGSGSFRAVDTPEMPGKPGPLLHDPEIRQWMVTADGSRHVFTHMHSYSDEYAYGDTNPYHEPEEAIAATVDTGAEIFGNIHTHWFPHHIPSQNPEIYVDTSSFTPRLEGWRLLEGLYDVAYENTIWVYEWDGFYSGNGLLDLHERSMNLQFEVISYILARSAPYYNVMLNIGFELCDYSDVPEWPTLRASLVRALDPWERPIAAHQCNNEWYQYPDDEEIGMSALQAQDAFHDRALDVWNSPAKPNPHLSEGIWNAPWQEPGTEESHRHDLWESVTGGMSVFFWPRDNDTGLDSFRHVNTFLRGGVRWWTTSPRDDLVASGGARLLADPGRVYVAYDASGSSFEVEMEEGVYRYRWFDPETGVMGDWIDLDVTSPGPRSFSKPESDHYVLEIGIEEITVGAPDGDAASAPPVGRVERLAPNPFSVGTVVHFAVADEGRVRVDVFGIDGRRVRRLVDREMAPGEHVVAWDGHNELGEPVASGTYVVRMRTAGGEDARRALVIR